MVIIFLLFAIFLNSCSYFEKLKEPTDFFSVSEVEIKNIPKNKELLVQAKDVDLKKIIEIALRNNPRIGVIQARIDAAHSRINLALMEYYPEINLSGGIRHSWNRERFLPVTAGEDPVFAYNYFFADLAVKIPLYTGGSSKKRKDALTLEHAALKFTLKRAKQTLIFEIIRHWYTIIRNRLLRDEIAISITNLKKIKDLTALMVNEQKAARISLSAIETRIGQLEYEKIRIDSVIFALFSSLSTLSGVDFKVGMENIWKLDENLPSLNIQRDWYNEAISHRDDITGLFMSIRSQEMATSAKQSSIMPSIYGVINYGYRLSADGDSGDSGFAGLEISFPFLNYFRISAELKEEKAKLRILVESMRELKLNIRQEINDALAALKTAQAMISSSKQTVKYATENYEITKKKSELSMIDATQLLLAHQELLSAKSNYYKAVTDWYLARAKLFFAAGIDK